MKKRVVLLGSVFVVAACGLVYELIAGAVSSYLLGDAVTQFSLVIGVFLCAMGIGSYLSKFITKKLLYTFIEIEIWIGLVGGSSSVAMFAVNALASPLFSIFFYSLCAFLGILVGVEIPLLIRILKGKSETMEEVSHVLAIDYLGALAGAVAFPLVALPILGLSRASVVFGLMNLAVAAAGVIYITGRKLWIKVRIAIAFCMLLVLLVFSSGMVGFFEDLLYQDNIVFAKDSRYQRIVITRWRDDVRLFLNGHIQFCSIDEARYHEALVIPAMEAAPMPRKVLILGGGDGLAAREVLKYPTVEKIVLVDLDPEMTRLAKSRPELLMLNNGSLNSEKVFIVNQDAMHFIEVDREFYEAIIIDLPDPNSDSMSKLYSRSFYALAAKRLGMGGVLVTQATSPFFAPEAYWCIVSSVEQAIPDGSMSPPFIALPYHVHVPSFGEWGFVMASTREIDFSLLSPKVETRFLSEEALQAMFAFGKDISRIDMPPNNLDNPLLFRYYKRGWSRFFSE